MSHDSTIFGISTTGNLIALAKNELSEDVSYEPLLDMYSEPLRPLGVSMDLAWDAVGGIGDNIEEDGIYAILDAKVYNLRCLSPIDEGTGCGFWAAIEVRVRGYVGGRPSNILFGNHDGDVYVLYGVTPKGPQLYKLGGHIAVPVQWED